MNLEPQKVALDNDVSVLYKRLPSNPFVAFRGNIWAGAASEEKRGVAEFTARLLMGGTKGLKAAQLAERIERLGATLDFGSSEEGLHFSGRCPRTSAAKLMEVMVDCLSHPTFPSAEIGRVRGEILDEIIMDMDNTMRRAGRELLGFLYPNHVYGRDPRGESSDVKRVRRADVVTFHSLHYGPKGMMVALSGDVDEKLVERDLVRVLLKFDGEGERPRLPTPATAKKAARVVPMPHKSQVDIALGLRAIPRKHDDFHALSMANLLFGRIGLFGRLGKNLRDEQGLAYYSFSTLDARTAGGHLAIVAGVNPDNLQRAVEGMRKETSRLHDEPLTEEEISDGKDNQVGALKVMLERNAEMAAELHRIEYFDLGLDYLVRYPGIIRGLTVSQIRKAAEKYIRFEDCSIAVAGPVAKSVEKSLLSI